MNPHIASRPYWKATPSNSRTNKKPNLFLFGNTGLGKTFFLSCLTRALHERGIKCEMVPAYDLFDAMRRQHLGQANALRKYGALPFLAIDDLGVEPMYRNITVEYLNKLLDLRLQRHLATAVTTNLDNGALAERYGERILSRLYDQRLFDFIGLRGPGPSQKPAIAYAGFSLCQWICYHML